MAYFTWSDQLSTGIPIIDQQHAKLVSYVNALSDAMNQGKGRDAVGPLLKELVAYTDSHFRKEEEAFERYAYPQRAAHQAAHQDLRKKLDDYVERFQRNELALSIDMLRFLTTWVKDHIMKEDMAYVPFLRDKLR